MMESTTGESREAAYFSYLLRVWCEDGDWRASLDSVETGKRAGFASLEMLFEHLRQETRNPMLTRKETNP